MHGHGLLMNYIISNKINIDGKNMIEIGCTREIIKGQNSTYHLSKLCKEKNAYFISVDMDPDNISNVNNYLIDMGFNGICSKGEDFLEKFNENIDYVYLDAFDYDHGNHSEKRKKSYIVNLNIQLSDNACHKMHLICCQILNKKMKKNGIICFDDCWLSNNKWCGKGTTAVPYLLNSGWKIICNENKALLLIKE